MSDIQVLLAIQNGEKYLAELLTSLVEQKECEIHLIVGFDNTNDRSETILESFKSGFKTLTVYRNNFGHYKENFNFLFSNRLNGMPLAFCDQDDVWLPTKIQNSLQILSMKKIPTLVTSPVIIMDTRKVFPSKVLLTQTSSIFVNPSKGCTQVLNVELQELIESLGGFSDINFYDWWVYVVALSFGEVVYLNHPSIEYRIHLSNAIGQPSFKKNVIRSIDRMKETGSLISPESLTYLFKVLEFSRTRSIQYSGDLYELSLLLQKRRIMRTSIFWKRIKLHPESLKNFILKASFVLLPLFDQKPNDP